MKKRPTTSDVLKAMDLAHRRKVKQDHAMHEQNKAFIRRMCDAGLVDDVDPDPGAALGPPPTLLCAVCGRIVPFPLLSCPLCAEEAEEIEW